MKSKYLNSIFKNQFYKTFKKSINYRINEVREKNRNQLSKIIFDLYMDIFKKKILTNFINLLNQIFF